MIFTSTHVTTLQCLTPSPTRNSDADAIAEASPDVEEGRVAVPEGGAVSDSGYAVSALLELSGAVVAANASSPASEAAPPYSPARSVTPENVPTDEVPLSPARSPVLPPDLCRWRSDW